MGTKKQQFKELRRIFREQVFERDNHCCKFCDEKENLDAHHITNRHEMPCDGYVITNGITLCQKHHIMAEMYATGDIFSFSPEKLYEKINSSYEKALEDCKKLEKI